MSKRLTLAVAIACAAYVAFFVWCAVARVPYPFEVEWMEGGMLTHAARVREGLPIYGKPSVEFVPFFYTPLYPMIVAWLSKIGGALTFALARSVTVGATVGTMGLLYLVVAREAGRVYGVVAVGFYAASYRFGGTFHDLVRPDALALALAFAATCVARRATKPHVVVLAAALFVAAFFAKQTSAVMAPAAVLMVFLRDKKLGAFFGAAGIVFFGALVWLYDRTTDHWFWFYIFKGHQGHLFYWKNILLEYWRDVVFLAPALLLVPIACIARGRWTRWIAGALVVFLGVAIAQGMSTLDVLAGGHMYYRELFYIKQRAVIIVPPIAVAVLLAIHRFSEDAPRTKIDPFWLVMFAAGALSSGLNHSTQWAYSNCFMPIALYGSVVVALALKSFAETPRGAALVAAAIGVQLVVFAYDPRAQVPGMRDRIALAIFEKRVADIDGPVLVPAHPFVAYQRSRAFHLHQMGTGDVGFEGGVGDIGARLARGEWRAVIMDAPCELPELKSFYYESDRFNYDTAQELMPRTGFTVRPTSLWRAQNRDEHELVPGITGTFERGAYTGWASRDSAFGPVPSARGRTSDIQGLQGNYAASSRGTGAPGALVSSPFRLDKPRVTMLMAGASTTYVRVMSGSDEIQRIYPPKPPQAQARSIDLRAHVGRTISIEIVDEGGSGIVVDDVRVAE